MTITISDENNNGSSIIINQNLTSISLIQKNIIDDIEFETYISLNKKGLSDFIGALLHVQSKINRR